MFKYILKLGSSKISNRDRSFRLTSQFFAQNFTLSTDRGNNLSILSGLSTRECFCTESMFLVKMTDTRPLRLCAFEDSERGTTWFVTSCDYTRIRMNILATGIRRKSNQLP